jgi:hypothetical protein
VAFLGILNSGEPTLGSGGMFLAKSNYMDFCVFKSLLQFLLVNPIRDKGADFMDFIAVILVTN